MRETLVKYTFIWAVKTARQGEALATKLDVPSVVPGPTQQEEKADSHSLSSDFHLTDTWMDTRTEEFSKLNKYIKERNIH